MLLQRGAEEIIAELFPEMSVPVGNQPSELDTLVVKLSQDLIDDYPASDPRWAENARSGKYKTTNIYWLKEAYVKLIVCKWCCIVLSLT